MAELKYIDITEKNMKSVQSKNPCQSVIQTFYDIVKAHGGELKVEMKEVYLDEPVGREVGVTFIIQLPV